MLQLAIISVICGAMLGNYFKVLVLPIVILLGVISIIVRGIADLEGTGSIVEACIIFAICIQSGYLAGAFLQPGSFASRHTSAQPGFPKDGPGFPR
jgi:hypothetical protein